MKIKKLYISYISYKVNVLICEDVPVCGHFFIFFPLIRQIMKKPYDNLHKHYPGIIRSKLDMSYRC